MKTIRAVLFDLDGTLINTLEDLADAVNHALAAFGYPRQETERFKYFAGNGIPKMIERALPPDARGEENVRRLLPEFFSYYDVHGMDKTTRYEGMSELLAALRRKGYLLGVVTNKAEPAARRLLDGLYPGGFDLIFGAREGVPAKPDPTLARLAMERLGVTPEECVFVGDSDVDIETAVNSGACPVGVLWGFRGEEELRAAGAKRILRRPAELLALLKEENADGTSK